MYGRVQVSGAFSFFQMSAASGASVSVASDVFGTLVGTVTGPGGAQTFSGTASTNLGGGGWTDLAVAFVPSAASAAGTMRMYVNGSAVAMSVAGTGAPVAAQAWMETTMLGGSVKFSVARIFVGGTSTQYDQFASNQNGYNCTSMAGQTSSALATLGRPALLVPGSVPGLTPVHWWSATAQPGAWGMADLLVDSGGAHADAAAVAIVHSNT